MKHIKQPRGPKHFFLAVFYLLSITALSAKAAPQETAQIISDASGNPIVSYKNSVALVIYVDKYSQWRPLTNTAAEALQVKEALEGQGFLVKLVENPRNYLQLTAAIHEFSSYYNFRKDVDRVVIFYTGHGFSRRDVGFLIPADTPNPRISASGDDPVFYANAFPMEELYQRVANSFQNRHILIILDACNSGSIFSNKAGAGNTFAQVSIDLINNPSRQVITAGSANEEVPARSIFTPLLIQALSGMADNDGSGYITGSELANYLLKEVPAKQLAGHPQSPQYGRITKPSEQGRPQGEIVFSAHPIDAKTANSISSQIIQDDDVSLRRRSQYTVEYFPSSRVNDEPLVQAVLTKLGFNVTRLNSVLDARLSDSLWVGGKVDIRDVKLLAYTLIQDGVRLKAIRTFKTSSRHPNPEILQKIQIGADRALPSDCKPLTIEQIQNSVKIDRTTLVCAN